MNKLLKSIVAVSTGLAMAIGVGAGLGKEAKAIHADGEAWVETSISNLSSNDVIVIVDKTSGKALFNGNGASSAPTATSITLNTSKTEITSSVSEDLKWTITISDSTYQFTAPGDAGKLYCTNTNNGVRVGSNDNNVFTIEDGFLLNSATSRYIGVYNSQDWRCYTSINSNIENTKTAFYKFTSSGGGNDSATGTIKFGSASGSLNVNSSSVTGKDDLDISWTVTTSGTTSFTANSGYAQIGSGSKPASSISFSASLGNPYSVVAFSAKFGGFSGTAGDIALKVGTTSNDMVLVGSGSLNATNDVVVESSISSNGSLLSIDVSNISKGVKVYYISYTFQEIEEGVTYTVTYNSNDASRGTAPIDSTEYESGGTVIVLGNTGNLEKDGYAFGGWNTAANGSGITYLEDDTFTINGNITLYAKWNAPGSENNPFTVAEAIAHVDGVSGTDNNTYYVTGIISAIVTPYSEQYHNISYNISDDGSVSGAQLEIYRGAGNSSVDASDISIGATVVVSGKLIKYGSSTYEFAQGTSTLISYVESPLNLVSIELSGNYPTVFYVGDTFHHEGLVATVTFDDGTEEDVANAADYSGYDTSVAGTQEVTVSFKHKKVTKTASYNIVVKAGTAINYELYGEDTIVEGDYLIYYEGGALNTTISSHRAQFKDLTATNNVISNNSEFVVWHIAPSDNYFTIFNKEENKYLASTGENNQIQLLDNGLDDKSLWSITINNGDVEIVNKYNSANELHSNLRRNENHGFACYGESTGGALSLYKKVAISYLESATPVATIRGVAETDNNGKVTAVNALTLRFGVKVSADEWDAAGITEYGVKMFFANSLDGVATVESRGNNVATVSANAEPFKDGQGNYIFMAVVRIPDDSSEWPSGFNKNTYFCVRPYVKVGEQTHWLLDGDTHESIKTLAIARNNTNLTEDALDFLAK